MWPAGVAVRSGHHCTQPLHAYLGINASARASPYIYNTEEEIDIFIKELEDSISFFPRGLMHEVVRYDCSIASVLLKSHPVQVLCQCS